MGLVQADPHHDEDNEFFAIGFDVFQKDAVIVTNRHSVIVVEIVQQSLDDEPTLTRREPLILFLLWVNLVGGLSEALDRKRHRLVVITKTYHLLLAPFLGFIVNVG